MEKEKTKWKERINYYVQGDAGDKICGYPVNIHGVTVQAESLEELKSKTKSICMMWLKFIKEGLEQDDPFELVEVKDFNEWLYGEREAKEKKLLQRYKDMFGDLPEEE